MTKHYGILKISMSKVQLLKKMCALRNLTIKEYIEHKIKEDIELFQATLNRLRIR